MPYLVVPEGLSTTEAMRRALQAGASFGSALNPREGLGIWSTYVRLDFADTPGEIERWGTAVAMALEYPDRVLSFQPITLPSNPGWLTLPGEPLE